MKITLHTIGQVSSKKFLFPVVAVGLVGGTILGASLLTSTPAKATGDTPLVDQVNQQGQELQNHETRITNAESDINGIKQTTPTSVSTAPSTATSTGAAPSAQTVTASVTVSSYQKIPLDSDGNIDCKFTYSDGTFYQWHWTVVTADGSWMTDGVGQNGHWVPSTQTFEKCDASTIGSTKDN